MISRRLEPDQIIVSRLVTEARRLAREQGRMKRAIRTLESASEGRTDLLAEAARVMLHNYVVDPLSRHPDNLLAVGLLVATGADPDLVADFK